MNVEHLLNVFASTDSKSNDVWDACADFMWHIDRHKPRLVIFGSKVEGLPDYHPSKPRCLVELSKPLFSVGNLRENKRLLVHALDLWKERGVDHQIAGTLTNLSRANNALGLHKEGILQANEAQEIYERLDNPAGQVDSLRALALALVGDGQVDAAEEAASRILDLSSEGPSQSQLCQHYHTLGHIRTAGGDTGAAIRHHEKALEIASSFNLRDERATVLHCLVVTLLENGRFDDARIHVEYLKSDGINNPISLALAVVIQIHDLCQQGRSEEAKSEASRLVGLFERIGASEISADLSEDLFRMIEEGMNTLATDT